MGQEEARSVVTRKPDAGKAGGDKGRLGCNPEITRQGDRKTGSHSRAGKRRQRGLGQSVERTGEGPLTLGQIRHDFFLSGRWRVGPLGFALPFP